MCKFILNLICAKLNVQIYPYPSMCQTLNVQFFLTLTVYVQNCECTNLFFPLYVPNCECANIFLPLYVPNCECANLFFPLYVPNCECANLFLPLHVHMFIVRSPVDEINYYSLLKTVYVLYMQLNSYPHMCRTVDYHDTLTGLHRVYPRSSRTIKHISYL